MSQTRFVGIELLRENELNKSDKIQKQKDVYAYPKFLLSMEAFLVEMGTVKSAMHLFFSVLIMASSMKSNNESTISGA